MDEILMSTPCNKRDGSTIALDDLPSKMRKGSDVHGSVGGMASQSNTLDVGNMLAHNARDQFASSALSFSDTLSAARGTMNLHNGDAGFASQSTGLGDDLVRDGLCIASTHNHLALSGVAVTDIGPSVSLRVAPFVHGTAPRAPAVEQAVVHNGVLRERTDEQCAILEFAAKVVKDKPRQNVLVVTAGAGTGKTTVLLWLIRLLVERTGGEFGSKLFKPSEIAYLVFNKAAAAAAVKTFEDLCLVSTLSACALATLARKRNCKAKLFSPSGPDSFQTLVLTVATTTFQEPPYDDFRESLTAGEVKWLCGRFAVVIEAFIVDFMHSSKTAKEHFLDGHPASNFAQDALPAAYTDLHESTFAEQHRWLARFRHGVAGGDNTQRVHYYACALARLWTAMTEPGRPTSFDAITKYVALERLRPVVSTGARREPPPPLKVVVLDEAQDLSACQLSYLAELVELGIFVVFVGDSMQTIYKFRGTTGVHYVQLARGLLPTGKMIGVELNTLTTCFRCAKAIVAAANAVLIGKANSDQCDEFTPYVLRPAADASDGELLSESLLGGRAWGAGPIVVLGRSRLSLLHKLLELLALDDPPIASLGGDYWGDELARIRELLRTFELELAQPGALHTLTLEPFPGLPPMTWHEIESAIVDGPIPPLKFALGVVNTYGAQLRTMLRRFDELLRTGLRADVQVMLLTVHAAKGLEFDTVELLDDFVDLSAWAITGGRGRMAWRAGDDEINLWYVALTRAKKRLVVPPKFLALVRDMRAIGAAGASATMDGVGCPLVLGAGRSACSFAPADVLSLRAHLYEPWMESGGALVLSQLR